VKSKFSEIPTKFQNFRTPPKSHFENFNSTFHSSNQTSSFIWPAAIADFNLNALCQSKLLPNDLQKNFWEFYLIALKVFSSTPDIWIQSCQFNLNQLQGIAACGN
jgi:hypothetical protein